MDSIKLGVIVKELRLDRGLDQRALAERAGISQSEVAKIEGGRAKRPSAQVLIALARALGGAPDALLGELEGVESGEPSILENREIQFWLDQIDNLPISDYNKEHIRDTIRAHLIKQERAQRRDKRGRSTISGSPSPGGTDGDPPGHGKESTARRSGGSHFVV